MNENADKKLPWIKTYQHDMQEHQKDGQSSNQKGIKEVIEKNEEKQKLKKESKELLKKSFNIKDSIDVFNKKNKLNNNPTIKNTTPLANSNEIEKKADVIQKKSDTPYTPPKDKVEHYELEKDVLKTKQEKIIKKKKLEKEWKDFQLEKEKFREKGLRVNDLRKYENIKATKKKSTSYLYRFVVFVTVVLILSGIAIISYSIITKPEEKFIPSEEVLFKTNDAFQADKEYIFGIEGGLDSWKNILLTEKKLDLFYRFLIFDGITERHLRLEEFLSFFSINMPNSLIQSLSDYYLFAKYETDDSTNYILVFETNNYTRSLVSLIAWEESIPKDLLILAPDAFNSNGVISVDINTKTIDNKSVKTIKAENSLPVHYYFFDKKLIVFVIGDEKIINKTNEKIIEAKSVF